MDTLCFRTSSNLDFQETPIQDDDSDASDVGKGQEESGDEEADNCKMATPTSTSRPTTPKLIGKRCRQSKDEDHVGEKIMRYIERKDEAASEANKAEPTDADTLFFLSLMPTFKAHFCHMFSS